MGWFKNLIARTVGRKIAKQAGLVETPAGIKNLAKGAEPMDDGVKSWWKSKGIWSGVLAILVVAYNAIAAPLSENFGVVLPPIPEWILALLGGMGIYGRVTATKKIG